MALMTTCSGSSVITETVFENRFMHVAELMRMGAGIKIDGRSAIVEGQNKLLGAQVKCTDLRAWCSVGPWRALLLKDRPRCQTSYHVDRRL